MSGHASPYRRSPNLRTLSMLTASLGRCQIPPRCDSQWAKGNMTTQASATICYVTATTVVLDDLAEHTSRPLLEVKVQRQVQPSHRALQIVFVDFSGRSRVGKQEISWPFNGTTDIFICHGGGASLLQRAVFGADCISDSANI